MKKLGITLALALTVSGVLFAQVGPFAAGRWGTTQAPTQIVKAEGKLALINGMIGLKSGTKTYYLPMLGRLAGFMEGVKEGASVKVEGYENPIAAAPEYSVLMVTKLTAGGKDYDFSQFAGGGI